MREKLDLDFSHPFSHAISALQISHVRERETKGSWVQIPREIGVFIFSASNVSLGQESKIVERRLTAWVTEP